MVCIYTIGNLIVAMLWLEVPEVNIKEICPSKLVVDPVEASVSISLPVGVDLCLPSPLFCISFHDVFSSIDPNKAVSWDLLGSSKDA